MSIVPTVEERLTQSMIAKEMMIPKATDFNFSEEKEVYEAMSLQAQQGRAGDWGLGTPIYRQKAKSYTDMISDVMFTEPVRGVIVSSPSYCSWQHEPDSLMRYARKGMMEIPERMDYEDCDFVVVTGSSGLLYMGMLLALGFDKPWLKVRKENEHSHGHKVEGRHGHRYHRGLFVDDGICSGRTYSQCKTAVVEHSAGRATVVAAWCYGVL